MVLMASSTLFKLTRRNGELNFTRDASDIDGFSQAAGSASPVAGSMAAAATAGAVGAFGLMRMFTDPFRIALGRCRTEGSAPLHSQRGVSGEPSGGEHLKLDRVQFIDNRLPAFARMNVFLIERIGHGHQGSARGKFQASTTSRTVYPRPHQCAPG